ncbi:MAG TPA: MerR family transcriptional regulator [Actinomycetota bacterium]|nr:MerR family transcriptional regulator [Actinomycetota bacterium]
MREAPWTLDELSERVDAALSVDYDGQPSGRVRVVPDRRSIRWYTTIGLVDRPAAHRGRTAMYGHRHLLQLVAIKRLQARGLPLVAIQAELAGATDAQLAGVARLPAVAPAPKPVVAPTPAPPIASLDAAVPAAPASGAAPALAAAPPVPASGAEAPVPAAARRARFWRERPVLATFATTEPATRDEPDPPAPDIATIRGLRLSRRATLLLDPARPLDAGDLRAILDAARPLLDALRARGLDGSDPGREHP